MQTFKDVLDHFQFFGQVILFRSCSVPLGIRKAIQRR